MPIFRKKANLILVFHTTYTHTPTYAFIWCYWSMNNFLPFHSENFHWVQKLQSYFISVINFQFGWNKFLKSLLFLVSFIWGYSMRFKIFQVRGEHRLSDHINQVKDEGHPFSHLHLWRETCSQVGSSY